MILAGHQLPIKRGEVDPRQRRGPGSGLPKMADQAAPTWHRHLAAAPRSKTPPPLLAGWRLLATRRCVASSNLHRIRVKHQALCPPATMPWGPDNRRLEHPCHLWIYSKCCSICKSKSVQKLSKTYFKTLPKVSKKVSQKYSKSIQNYPESIHKVSQKYLKRVLKVSQKYPKSILKVSQKYPKSISKVFQKYPKKYPKSIF